MEFKSNPRKFIPVDPFGSLTKQGESPGGPGIGVRRGQVMPAPDTKRRSASKQVFGDTPPRDGPFAPSAEPLATNYPTSARARGRKKPGGPNPFNVE